MLLNKGDTAVHGLTLNPYFISIIVALVLIRWN